MISIFFKKISKKNDNQKHLKIKNHVAKDAIFFLSFFIFLSLFIISFQIIFPFLSFLSIIGAGKQPHGSSKM